MTVPDSQAPTEEETAQHESTITTALLGWIFEDGFYNPNRAAKRLILATTNKKVDYWNKMVGDLNPNPTHIQKSEDSFADLDDDYGYLRELINDKVLDKYQSPNVPNHSLECKVDDVMILLRNLHISGKILSNSFSLILSSLSISLRLCHSIFLFLFLFLFLFPFHGIQLNMSL